MLTLERLARHSFIRFVGVGGVCTGLHYLILYGLVAGGGADPVFATVVGYAVSTLLSYALNRLLTFASSLAHRRALPRFIVVALIGCLLNAALLWAMVNGLKLHYLLGQVLATLVVLVWNYGANRRWTFAKP